MNINPLIFALLLFLPAVCFGSDLNNDNLENNISEKKLTISTPDKNLSLVIDYSKGCIIKELKIKGKNTLSNSGIFTGISTQAGNFTTLNSNKIRVSQSASGILISGINYGDALLKVTETWNFKINGKAIIWDVTRTYSNDAVIEDTAFPCWNFSNLSVWKGGILDNGGMVWCKYLKQVNDTYGVHTGGVTMWNADSGDALRISPAANANNHIAAKFSHNKDGDFTFTQLVTDTALGQRYNLSRFVNKHFDVFAPFKVKKGKVHLSLKLEYIDYFKEYSRGTLPGIDAVSVRELLNTTGRYGVVDNNIVGANGWLTNWKCLHEPFFSQIGMALNDPAYDKNMASTLDQERDLAMLEDGRVLSRWHNAPGDEIKGTYNLKTGYYEAMWGYTVDSQTGYVINASEQFDLNGDTTWLKSHKLSCERALNWLIRRDSDNDGIFEMVNNNIAEKKASDWLDIVWAGYENAFVNAQMYEALNLWSNCERVLGDYVKADYYSKIALRLKIAFNKTTKEGGFWSNEKKQYIYWRDKDGSLHGDNLVTPVNFAAVAFGLCDDKTRIAQVLNQIEQRSKAENLFHWPLCFDSFKREEVSERNWPFPKYENGDIFPTWGYLGIRAYAQHDKSVALKYITNLLAQYKKDGLSSQRYSRTSQTGLGDDILAGISTSITALYRDLYGIRPKWNRMGLEPNLSSSLDGTEFSYKLRGKEYQIKLKMNDYLIQSENFSVKSKEAFGVSKNGRLLSYYHHNQEQMILEVKLLTNPVINLEIKGWDKQKLSVKINSKGSYALRTKGLLPDTEYLLLLNGKSQKIKTKANGDVSFSINTAAGTTLSIEKQS